MPLFSISSEIRVGQPLTLKPKNKPEPRPIFRGKQERPVQASRLGRSAQKQAVSKIFRYWRPVKVEDFLNGRKRRALLFVQLQKIRRYVGMFGVVDSILAWNKKQKKRQKERAWSFLGNNSGANVEDVASCPFSSLFSLFLDRVLPLDVGIDVYVQVRVQSTFGVNNSQPSALFL